MAAPAAMQGDFVDLRFVKGRKVCQVVIEIPIEAGASFVAAFGTPNPAQSVPVAIARLDMREAAQERKGGELAKKAGILCNEGGFRAFMKEQNMGAPKTAEEAAECLRTTLNIRSRADIDHDERAATEFKFIESSYRAWLAVA